MLLRDTMFVWTANRPPCDHLPTAGQIASTKIPEAEALKKHPSSYGTCNSEWVEADHDWRLAKLRELVRQWTAEDGIKIDDIRRACAEIEDINPAMLGR